MWLDPDHRGRRRRNGGGGSRCRSRRRGRCARPSRRWRPSRPRAGREGRRRGSRARTSRCGARCSGWDRAPGELGPSEQRTSPSGVWNCAAMMPGVPCGATHSTLTSSSGASTVSPSHSLTRAGRRRSPGRQGRTRASAPCSGAARPGVPLDEERQLRVGDQAVDADLLPRAARCRRGGGGCRWRPRARAGPRRRRCRRPPRPSPASRRRGRSGRGRPGRTAPCRTRGGPAPRRSRGRCCRPAAGSCCGCRSAGGRPRR